MSKNRKLEIENPKIFATYRQKIESFADKKEQELSLVEEPQTEYKTEINLAWVREIDERNFFIYTSIFPNFAKFQNYNRLRFVSRRIREFKK